LRKKPKTTPDHVGYMPEGVVLDVGWLSVLTARKVDGDELVGDVALFGYDGHAARASGDVVSVNLDDHAGARLVKLWTEA
jgi:hypothetical protein